MKLEGIYAILDYGYLKNEDILTVTNELLDAGVSLFQYRDKTRNRSEIRSTALKLLEIIKKRQAKLIINNYPEIAYDIGAGGYHVGQEDIGAKKNSKKKRDFITGRTVRNVEEGIIAEKEGYNYLGAGTVFPTATKTDGKIIGINGLRDIVNAVTIPVFAIGGINYWNLDQVLTAGASGAAMISGLYSTDNIKHNARNLIKIFKRNY